MLPETVEDTAVVFEQLKIVPAVDISVFTAKMKTFYTWKQDANATISRTYGRKYFTVLMTKKVFKHPPRRLNLWPSQVSFDRLNVSRCGTFSNKPTPYLLS